MMAADLGVLGAEYLRDRCQAGRSSPAHQHHGERGRGYPEAVLLLLVSAKAPPSKPGLVPPGVCSPHKSKSGGIRKSPVVVADMRSFGREVQLLEKLGGYCNTGLSPRYVLPFFYILHEPIPVVRRRHVELSRL